jgi:pyruvate/2-oxoglutarate dehydrogenase complex dihydrolipoamide dehydrogenase (E3) component
LRLDEAANFNNMVGTQAGDMIGEIALAIEMGAEAVDAV